VINPSIISVERNRSNFPVLRTLATPNGTAREKQDGRKLLTFCFYFVSLTRASYDFLCIAASLEASARAIEWFSIPVRKKRLKTGLQTTSLAAVFTAQPLLSLCGFASWLQHSHTVQFKSFNTHFSLRD